VGTQTRIGTGKQVFSNYLDGTNGNNTNFSSMYIQNPDAFNDVILGITHDELMLYLGANLAIYLRDFFINQNDAKVPPIFNSISSILPAWLANENWIATHSPILEINRDNDSSFSFRFTACNIRFSMTLDGTFNRSGNRCR
jgi:hypothetical protein